MKFMRGFARTVAVGPTFNQSRRPPRLKSLLVVPAVATLLALFFGLAAAVLPWQILVGFLALPVLLIVGATMPTLLFVVAMLLLFGIVPEFIMAALPLGGATLRPAELVLIFCFLAVILRIIAGQIDIMNGLKPLRMFLAVLGCGLVLGLVKGKLLSHNTLAMADARQFLGWLALPIGLWFAVAHPGRLQRIVIGIALLAAVLMVLQLGLGVQLIFGFRGAENLSKEFNDVTRSAIGGGLFFLGYAAYRLFLHACDGERWRWTALLGSLIAIGGVLSSFNRAVWAGFAIGAIALLILKPRTRRSALLPLLVLVVFVCIAMAGLFAVKPNVADAVVERALSLQNEGQRGSSLGFRFDENAQAIATLEASPVVGVGMGGEYKRAFRQLSTSGGFDIETSFIHNGYLSLWLKLGIFGLLLPALLLLAGWRMRRGQSASGRLTCAAGFACLLLLDVSLLTSADLSTSSGTAAMASILALMLADRMVTVQKINPPGVGA